LQHVNDAGILTNKVLENLSSRHSRCTRCGPLAGQPDIVIGKSMCHITQMFSRMIADLYGTLSLRNHFRLRLVQYDVRRRRSPAREIRESPILAES